MQIMHDISLLLIKRLLLTNVDLPLTMAQHGLVQLILEVNSITLYTDRSCTLSLAVI